MIASHHGIPIVCVKRSVFRVENKIILSHRIIARHGKLLRLLTVFLIGSEETVDSAPLPAESLQLLFRVPFRFVAELLFLALSGCLLPALSAAADQEKSEQQQDKP